MDERKFLRAINCKDNINGEFTYSAVYQFLDKSSSITIPRKIDILKNFLRINRNSKLPAEIIDENFEQILYKTNNYYLGSLLNLLLDNESTRDMILENFDIVLERFRTAKNYGNSKEMEVELLGFSQEEFFEKLKQLPEGQQIIKDNCNNILGSVRKKNLFKVVQVLKGISRKLDNNFEHSLKANHLEVSKFLLSTTKIRPFYEERKDKLINDYTVTLSTIIQELLKSEKAKWLDINRIGGGGYSDVYQIGDKILKIGSTRGTYNIPNHTRILQPLTRINLLDEEKDNMAFACIEICDKVNPLGKEDMGKGTLYKIYKELRDDGIIWSDVRFPNLGRLRKPNIPTLNGEKMKVAPNSIGFDEKIRGKELENDDIVILDTDFIYNQDSPNIVWAANGLSLAFEKRWQQEQQAKIAEKHSENKNTERVDEKNERQ